ncbi:CDP-diacylglycerol-glycerol-3-phosphate 3-phosphatidyltransferase [Taphrina deformans PYCC 5710]|uniref:CDP-diacylglycerol--glycerol-3-phosphate 3-phosphatidyltransferase n=1 Tax=Taphrina deformans (strain PYCC 5710 / ATCC 11124 / CBS 356.35 / IMI 108563 / JCM 9778 / NBRC 8474) TaxID=1097556 RepID=R4X8P9_TAPDE|nr:CDP-diacylglycerol-glycerol-3-phosphate 3-phosphatidyltransferase [Taphrina deformans PYCC 5710]|eukprot:CCG81765.1 CDP-diacylglycerol-glycerol-3-phosphate 3-phosphatidyltransferase [Taphrina deformans PYCC 5710]
MSREARSVSEPMQIGPRIYTFDAKYRQLSIALDKLSPRIDLPPGCVKILESPTDFYETLLDKISTAKNRIFLSTLYIGKTEHELVAVLRKRMSECPTLKLSILTDALRGTRETPKTSCASLLAPLLSEFGLERVEISMFHTPGLHGWRKAVIPRRFDEGWGLQHMKLYGFDDEILLSGANLSGDYFTDRQDRYQLFSHPEVTRFYERLHDAISSISYHVQFSQKPSGYTLLWTHQKCPEPIKDPKRYKEFASSLIRTLIVPKAIDHCDFTAEQPPASILYPLVQMTSLFNGPFSTEQPVLNTVLDVLATEDHKETTWVFTAGYFNVFEDYRSRLLKALGKGTVITASPDANGFYKSSGPSGMLAAAYTLLSKRFLQDIKKQGKNADILLREWRRGTYGEAGRWTYHAKGLWLQPRSADSVAPSLTFIGSSNFTRRSQNLDLEATAVLITADHDLQRALGREVQNLQAQTRQVSIEELSSVERKADWKTRFALWLCQGML